jgi:hypothetical protein
MNMEICMERKPEAAAQTQETKKPYHTPEVIVYGNIREVTRNLGSKGNLDGGGGSAAGPKTGV